MHKLLFAHFLLGHAAAKGGNHFALADHGGRRLGLCLRLEDFGLRHLQLDLADGGVFDHFLIGFERDAGGHDGGFGFVELALVHGAVKSHQGLACFEGTAFLRLNTDDLGWDFGSQCGVAAGAELAAHFAAVHQGGRGCCWVGHRRRVLRLCLCVGLRAALCADLCASQQAQGGTNKNAR